MKILETGTLSTVTGITWGSGVSSAPIDLSNIGNREIVGLWARIKGDLGRTGGSVSLMYKGSYAYSGASYTTQLRENLSHVTGNMLIKSGTSVTGFYSDGSYLKSFTPIMPFVKLEAIQSQADGDPGAGTTNNLSIDWAICVP